jgi:hypothetical protein
MLDAVPTTSVKSLRLFKDDIDVLVLRTAAQQEHVRSFQDLEEWNFGPAGAPPQRLLVAIGRAMKSPRRFRSSSRSR